MTKLSETLVSLRRDLGLTQLDLAKMLGLSRSAIGMYESGKREPNLETLELFANYFHVDMNTLTGQNMDAMPLHNEDRELTEYLEMLRSRPEMRMLFSTAKGATKSDVEKAVAIIEALRKAEGRE
ncbi:MAG: helix-turn-helix transcriptional regulator [Oscillospiraceae bacterium]|nr:helix-turn-helix transcriptional regulator [Oscillospiraceae bacterium]